MNLILIKNARLINEGIIIKSDVLIEGNKIAAIGNLTTPDEAEIIEAEGLFLIPGAIDDQVHFREPGLTHKGNIFSESRAAAAGGITSFMEMPNTVPNTFTIELLEEKFAIAEKTSMVNFSFYMGASNENLQEVLKVNPNKVCGIKIFMGSSTGNMLVDNPETLKGLFEQAKLLIAVHCEDEATIRNNLKQAQEKFGENIPASYHPVIRNHEACYKSSSLAVELARKYNTRLHILHISTERELSLFEKGPLKNKRITSEACIHHLWFTDQDYESKGNFIKWNPAVKTKADREALLEAVNTDIIDVIATDHAPHTLEEKSNPYISAPSGGPLVQHALLAMFDLVKQGKMNYEKVIEKMCHAPADLFNISKRGYIREGYYADLVLVDPDKLTHVTRESLIYKCGWSPFEGYTFSSSIVHTIVNGQVVYSHTGFIDGTAGMRLEFER